MFKNALVSVSDKRNIVEFVKPLAEQGMRILSTGGTAKHLRAAGLEVVDVSAQTDFPEVMDGRVKTLHPKIHMALLARGDNAGDLQILKEYGLEPIDLVIGNLYPFEEALREGKSDQELTEYIDIGGPSFLRAAAKNYDRIAVITDPQDYQWVAETGELNIEQRKFLASKVYGHTARYDALISWTLHPSPGKEFSFGGEFVQKLRYGENPQQKAAWYRNSGFVGGLHMGEVLQGKELSFNNILDLEAATRLVREFEIPAVIAVKHNNPCGVATGEIISEVTQKALLADPVSVFGGIIAMNRKVDGASAEHLKTVFLECVIAPDFDEAALEILSSKKNLRLLRWPGITEEMESVEIKTVEGGFLVQSLDVIDKWGDDWTIVGKEPSVSERNDLSFAWRVCACLKSNAIAIAAGGQTLGLGMGQVNRVDAVKQAIERSQVHHAGVQGAVLASDAFFPFADSIELAAKAGINWIIQPGGSVRDEEVIAKAKEKNVNMVLTGKRHFRH